MTRNFNKTIARSILEISWHGDRQMILNKPLLRWVFEKLGKNKELQKVAATPGIEELSTIAMTRGSAWKTNSLLITCKVTSSKWQAQTGTHNKKTKLSKTQRIGPKLCSVVIRSNLTIKFVPTQHFLRAFRGHRDRLNHRDSMHSCPTRLNKILDWPRNRITCICPGFRKCKIAKLISVLRQSTSNLLEKLTTRWTR